MGVAFRDRLLCVCIENDQLIIRVGLATLAFAAERMLDLYDHEKHGASEGPYCTVKDNKQLAKDVIGQMLKKEEDGSTNLSRFFDQMTLDAIEDGSIAIVDDEDEEEFARRQGKKAVEAGRLANEARNRGNLGV